MRDKFNRFMQGRYGVDAFARFTMFASSGWLRQYSVISFPRSTQTPYLEFVIYWCKLLILLLLIGSVDIWYESAIVILDTPSYKIIR